MRHLTSLDAQFLAVESAHTYGHVGSLAIYDPSTAPGTDEPDPGRRLQRTHELLRSAKERHQALPADLLTDATAVIPPAVAALAARTTMQIMGRTRPALNLVISNVPGPRHPLFLAEAQLVATYPVSVVVHGVGLNITVMSYRDHLDFGLVADREQVDDLWPMLEGLRQALGEFEGAAGIAAKPVKRARKAPTHLDTTTGR